MDEEDVDIVDDKVDVSVSVVVAFIFSVTELDALLRFWHTATAVLV